MLLGELNRVLRASQLFIVLNDDGFPRIVPLFAHVDDRRLSPAGSWIDDLMELTTANARPTVVSDTSTATQSRSLQRANIGAYMAAPIVLRDERVFGYLCAADEVAREYTSNEIELLDWSANLVSYVVDVDQSSILDPLTGALNRSFLQRLKSGFQHEFGAPFALVFIDLDNFKTINDRYGHNIGDEVLKIVVHRLKRRIRLDDAVIRYGGDEFVILLNGITDRKQVVAAAARRLLEAVEHEYSIENESVRVSASVGVSVCSRGTEDIDALIEAADAAMYLQKASGGSGFKISDPRGEDMVPAAAREA